MQNFISFRTTILVLAMTNDMVCKSYAQFKGQFDWDGFMV